MTAIVMGAHPEMSDAEYRSTEAANYSFLKALLRNPARAKYERDNPTEPSAAMVFGSAYHDYMLQPLGFADAYIIRPDSIDGRTKAGKAWLAEHKADSRPIIKEEELSVLEAMRAALLAHDTAATMIAESEMIETPIFWQDPITTAWCKAKPDGVTPAVVFDLKTTDDASAGSFAKSIANFGYHIQAAHYLNGISEVTESCDREFVFIAQEKSPPYSVAVYTLDDVSIEEGHERAQEAMDIYQRGVAKNIWPAYSDGVEDISLPKWAYQF